MSLARALTRRYKSQEPTMNSVPGRVGSTRRYDHPIDRTQISLPIELLSSTNALAYEAPDIHDLQSISASSANSFEDSDSSRAFSSSSSISSPEQSSRESSPVSVSPNHLSIFFQLPIEARCSEDTSRLSHDADVPAVPSRAISHTKVCHQILARKRSQSQVRSPTLSVYPSTPLPRTSIDMFSSKPDPNHPFGAELAQVNELAEEFGVKDVVIWDEEEQFLVENGLQKFGAEDYAAEIQGLFSGVFDDEPFPMACGWI